MLVNILETAESLRPECLQQVPPLALVSQDPTPTPNLTPANPTPNHHQDESSAFAALFLGCRAALLLAVLLLLALLQWLVSRQCDRCLPPRKIDDYSVRLDFLETVIYQVQFASKPVPNSTPDPDLKLELEPEPEPETEREPEPEPEQVQFASSWRIIFDLVVVMAANPNLTLILTLALNPDPKPDPNPNPNPKP